MQPDVFDTPGKPDASTVVRIELRNEDLLEALGVLAPAVPSRSTIPILECVLLESDGSQLVLSATDLEIFVTRTLPIETEPFRLAVPARRLLETLRAIDEEMLLVQVDPDAVELRTSRGRYRIAARGQEEFPSRPDLEGGVELESETEPLARAMETVLFAASRDDLRPALNGVLWEVHPEEVRLVATDSHRLVRLVSSGLIRNPQGATLQAIIPERAMGLLEKMLRRSDSDTDTCRIRLGANQASFQWSGTLFTTRLIQESYPNYEAVIPVEWQRRVRFDREAFLRALKRVSLYASTQAHQVRLHLEPQWIRLEAEDIDRSSSAEERLPAELEGDPLVIGFNARYLQEALQHLESPVVVMECTHANRAAVLKPQQTEGPQEEEVLMLVMPVMLSGY
jgi:DNA polymerase-3 subunit beta